MPADPGILAIFGEPEAAARAIRALRALGHRDLRTAMPAAFPEVTQALGRPRSRLGWVTFAGAVVGVACGFGLPIGTSLAWPLVTGGKPIVSLPPFVIIGFEITVLIGSIVNLLALIIGAVRGGCRHSLPRDPRFLQDRIGVFVVDGDLGGAEEVLRANGAEEVRRVG